MRPLCRSAAVAAVALFLPMHASGAQTPDSTGSVRFLVPRDWSRQQASTVVVLTPPTTASRGAATLMIPEGEFLERGLDGWFEGRWREFLDQFTVTSVMPTSAGRSGAGDAMRIAAANLEAGPGDSLSAVFVAVHRGTRVQPLLFLASGAEAYQAAAPGVNELIATVAFLPPKRQGVPIPLTLATMVQVAADGSAAPAAPSPTAPLSANADTVSAPVPPDVLDGIYGGYARRMSFDWRGDVQFTMDERHVTFFANGLALRGVPAAGLDGFDPVTAEREDPSMWGRYAAVGSQRWELRWHYKPEVALPLEWVEGRLELDAEAIARLATGDGTVLDGRFTLANDEQQRTSVSFSPDGRFTDGGVIAQSDPAELGNPNRHRVPGGAGMYRIGRNTIYFAYDDGRSLRFLFYAWPEQLAARPIASVAINASWYARRGPAGSHE